MASPALHGPDKYSCFAFSSVQTSLLYSLVFTIAKISVKHTSILYSLAFTIAKIILKHREFRRELWIGENVYSHLRQISYSYSVAAPLSNGIPPLNTFIQMVLLWVPQYKLFLAEVLKKIDIQTSNLWKSLPVYYDTLLHYNTWQQKKKPTLHKTSRTH